eukprot:4269420-Prorocentrum_lima.AAC.1
MLLSQGLFWLLRMDVLHAVVILQWMTWAGKPDEDDPKAEGEDDGTDVFFDCLAWEHACYKYDPADK